jgi:hypothetical protein
MGHLELPASDRRFALPAASSASKRSGDRDASDGCVAVNGKFAFTNYGIRPICKRGVAARVENN